MRAAPVKWCCPNSEAFVLMNFACPNLSQGRTLLTAVELQAKELRTREHFRKGESYGYIRTCRQKQHNDRRSRGSNRCDRHPLCSRLAASNLLRRRSGLPFGLVTIGCSAWRRYFACCCRRLSMVDIFRLEGGAYGEPGGRWAPTRLQDRGPAAREGEKIAGPSGMVASPRLLFWNLRPFSTEVTRTFTCSSSDVRNFAGKDNRPPRLRRRNHSVIYKPVMNACGNRHPAMQNKIKEIIRTA